MAEKDDDFDGWLDDVDVPDSELDQENIDELLSAVESGDNDQAAPDAQEKSSGELDQDNIDALLGLTSNDSAEPKSDEADMGDLDQDNIDALLSGTGYDAEASEDFSLDELDQDNIDALLNSTPAGDLSDDDDELAVLAQDNIDALLADSSADDDSPDLSQSELEQDDIDSLFSNAVDNVDTSSSDDLDELFAGGDDEPEQAAAQTEVSTQQASPTDADELDQDNIDALFSDIDAASGPEKSAAPIQDVDELDELFAADDDTDAEAEAEVPKAATIAPEELSPEDADDLASSAFDSELDDMDQLFADIDNDIEDDDPFQAEEIDFAEMLGQSEGDDQEFIELEPDSTIGTGEDAAFMAQAGAEKDEETHALGSDGEQEQKASGLVIPAFLADMNKSILTGVGGGVVLLLLIGLYFLFSSPKETMVAQKEVRIPVQQEPVRKMAENFVPLTENAVYDMGSQGGEITIELSAVDKDDQPLLYDITSQPLHGRLSGTAPLLTYLPDNTFPGKDQFEFMVSDGTDTSTPALITITGPDLATIAKKESEKEKVVKKIFKPQKPKVLAKDVKYFTVSTGAVKIDWARLWQEANSSAYSAKEVHVEIVDTAMKGSLQKRDKASHTFTPDPYEARTDTIHYRFKKGGFRSATKTVTINVELGSPAPEINIAELADGYMVGQNVVIDASGSRDEARDSLLFSWEQVSGVQIDLSPVNAEGSRIAFSMPSSFYTDPNPGPTLAVTAVDNTGKEVRKEIKVKMVSRRQTALWRGENGSVASDPPMHGRYFPWPFDD